MPWTGKPFENTLRSYNNNAKHFQNIASSANRSDALFNNRNNYHHSPNNLKQSSYLRSPLKSLN